MLTDPQRFALEHPLSRAREMTQRHFSRVVEVGVWIGLSVNK